MRTQSAPLRTSRSSTCAPKVRQKRKPAPFHPVGQPTVITTPQDEVWAKVMARTYTELKRRWLGDSFRRHSIRPVDMGHFRKAAIRIRDLQRRGYPTNPGRFVAAVFTYFGAATFPAHFASENVWQMYFKWEERRAHAVAQGVDFTQEYDTLNHICASRGQTLEKAWPAIRNTGIFSPRFVDYADKLVKHARPA